MYIRLLLKSFHHGRILLFIFVMFATVMSLFSINHNLKITNSGIGDNVDMPNYSIHNVETAVYKLLHKKKEQIHDDGVTNLKGNNCYFIYFYNY